jgi:hypothetical protein
MYHFIGCFEEISHSTSKQKCNKRIFRHPYISISVNVLPYLLMNHFLFSKQIYQIYTFIHSKTCIKFKICWICYVFLSSFDFYYKISGVKNADYFSSRGNSDNLLTVCLIFSLILKLVSYFVDIRSSFATQKFMVDEFTIDLLMVW